MPEAATSPDTLARNHRLRSLLEQLAEQGISQQKIARQLNVPASYLSDVKLGRKAVSDTFARYFCTEFGVGLDWLLDGTGPQTKPQFAAPPVAGASAQVILPVLSDLIQGNPQDSTIWDGSRVELSGVAAAKAIRAYQPYVLRSPINDNLGRFQQNDLLLIDQKASELAAIVVILDRQQLTLARRTEDGYQALESGRAIGTQASLVGVCVGIV